MKRLFNFITILITIFFWTSCENLVEEEGPDEYSKPSSVEVSASNSRESLDITLSAKPSGRSIQSVASASFAYSLSEDLADATTVNATADGDAFTATLRSLDYGKRLYFQATMVNALGAQMTSSVENILIPPFSEFLNVSAPELVEAKSSSITLKSSYQSPEGVAIAERGFCWSTELAVPNVENNRVIAEGGFQTAIEGLEQMQTINARAYVKDASGNIAYSEVGQFSTDAVHVSEVSLNKTELQLNEGESQNLVATVKPDDATNKTVNWASSATDIATVDANGKVTAVKAGTAIITVTTVDGSKTASCTVTVTSPSSSSAEYVDLGLSVKWATCNLGASKPEGYGLYYQWGDIQGYGSDTGDGKYFYWIDDNGNVTYKWCKGSSSSLTKYNADPSYGIVDNKTILDPEDDVAHVLLGGKWRMPIEEEWTELRENCIWTWTTENGINGYRVTSKKSGYTDKYIFLPAAGMRTYSDLRKVGSNGYYWTSSVGLSPYSSFEVIFASGGKDWGSYSRYAGQSIRPVYGDAVQEVHVSSVSLNKTTLSLEEGQSETLSATASPSNATNKNVSWKSSDTSVANVDANGKVTAVKAGTATITATTVDGRKTASCTVTVTSPSSNSAEYVDLGLSVKWATCNLGATKPEGYGLYYQWGDTQGYGSDTNDGKYFYWYDDNGKVTYKWCNGSDNKLTKYNTKSSYGPVVDNKTVLDPADDAAHVALGGKWRMPTDSEWTELRTNCTWTWTTVNGIKGYRVTSKKSGYTSKSIFLPAAGSRLDDNLNFVGSDGSYWSSSLYTDYPYDAILMSFVSDSVLLSNRCYGRSIRPVSD